MPKKKKAEMKATSKGKEARASIKEKGGRPPFNRQAMIEEIVSVLNGCSVSDLRDIHAYTMTHFALPERPAYPTARSLT